MRNWTDKAGNKRTSAEVIADSVYFGDSDKTAQNANKAPITDNFEAFDDDDELPWE